MTSVLKEVEDEWGCPRIPDKYPPYVPPKAWDKRPGGNRFDSSPNGTPIPLRRGLPIPPFPDQLLPAVVGDMVRAVADYVQVPVGMAATSALGALSAVFGGYVEVQMSPEDPEGYVEPVNLYVGAVAESADRKSGCQERLSKPVQLLEQELIRQTRDQIAASAAERELAEADAEALRKQALRAGLSEDDKRTAQEAAVAAAVKLESIVVTAVPSIIEDDVTPESLGVALFEQGGQAAAISAEGGLFDVMSGMYTNGKANLGVFLKGHAGDHWKVRRISRAKGGEVIRRPALTVSMMIQPKILAAAVRKNEALSDAGVLARIVLDCSPSMVGKRKVRERVPIPADVRQRYTQLLVNAGLYFRLRPEQRVEATKETLRLTLSSGAYEAWQDYVDRTEPRLAGGADLEHIRSWAGKSTGLCGRLAGLLHMVAWRPEDGSEVITGEEMAAAIGLVEYFTAHALAAFDVMSSSGRTRDLAERVLRDIAKRELKQVSTSIWLGKGHPSWMPPVEVLREVFELLEDHHWITAAWTPQQNAPRRAGRPPVPLYDVHLSVFEPGFLNKEDGSDTSGGLF
jgi:replicative DNA helicase